MLRRMDEIRDRIARLATTYLDAFRNTSVATLLPSECDNAGLMRFPIAISGKEGKDILRLALKRGMYLAPNYGLLPQKSELGRFPNAVWAVQNVALLPLYRKLPEQSAQWLAKHIIEIANAIG
jgi:dTDP-4-amino-4,6-dideoxygalactose transaminase